MARQLIVQVHPLQITTQAVGNPKFSPTISIMIGEQKGKVICAMAPPQGLPLPRKMVIARPVLRGLAHGFSGMIGAWTKNSSSASALPCGLGVSYKRGGERLRFSAKSTAGARPIDRFVSP